jgi:predicted DNA-binding transcriptional regulator YafY
MASTQAEIILHPIRLRIIWTLLGRELTTRQIGAALSDVPQATLYRHIHRLHSAGILRVTAERPARGVPEKVYAVVLSAASLKPEETATISREEHLRYFQLFLTSLLDRFRAYLGRERIDLEADGVSYRIAPLHLSDAEFMQMIAELRAVVLPRIEYAPGPERKRRFLATIILPDAAEPGCAREEGG